MGGPGSGSWYRWDKKDTVENHPRLDVRELHREHGIKPGSWVTVNYEWRGEQVAQEILLDWTPCNYGGLRPWFICMTCGRRVAKIYLGGKYFACRLCLDLTYRSCQESDKRFRRCLRNYEDFGGVENMPLWALKGLLIRAWKKEGRLNKEMNRRRRGAATKEGAWPPGRLELKGKPGDLDSCPGN